MKILVTYQSKTGFTKKYAEWISEELKTDLKDIKEVSDVSDYDLVIHGGWIFGGLLKGFNKIHSLKPKRLIVFGVGLTPEKEVNLEKMTTENRIGEAPLFYFQGGTNPKKMGFMGRSMVKMVTKKKAEYQDNTNRDRIKPLIKAVKGEK